MDAYGVKDKRHSRRLSTQERILHHARAYCLPVISGVGHFKRQRPAALLIEKPIRADLGDLSAIKPVAHLELDETTGRQPHECAAVVRGPVDADEIQASEGK